MNVREAESDEEQEEFGSAWVCLWSSEVSVRLSPRGLSSPLGSSLTPAPAVGTGQGLQGNCC